MSLARGGRVAAWAAVAAAACAGGAAAIGAGCGESGVVGGECAAGLTQCALRCVNLSSDPQNCGACGNGCAAGQACVAGKCGLADGQAGGGGGGAGGAGTGGGGSGGADADGGPEGDAPEDPFSNDNVHPDWLVPDSDAGDGDAGGEAGTGGGEAGGAGGVEAGGTGGGPGGDAGAGGGPAGTGGGGGVEAGGVGGGGVGGGGVGGGGVGGGGVGGGGVGGGGVGGGGVGGGGVGGGGVGGGGVGGGAGLDAGDAGDACTPPYDKPTQCGDCVTKCVAPNPVCGPTDGGYACMACMPPLELCAGTCVDKKSDEFNCGACGKTCPTGICQSGQCIGSGTGHIAVLGMDYKVVNKGQPPAALLGNAVFLPPGNPVRILGYSEFSDKNAKGNVDQAIGWAATDKNRTFTMTDGGTPAQVATKLSKIDYDLLLVYDESAAPGGALGTTGTLWATAVDGFTKAGGAIVVLDGGSGTGEMRNLVTNAGLLPVSAVAGATGTQVKVTAPTDALALGVLTPFLARPNTVTLTTSQAEDSSHVFVVKNLAGTAPVVVHVVK